MSRSLMVLATSLLLVVSACEESHVSLGQAYVAPATLRLRGELSTKSNSVAEVKHGDHLEILDVQRRMVKVRTDKGVEGWVDSLQLLNPDQMAALKQRRQEEAKLPSEGSATAYEVLNIHVDPERQSPAFAQIPEGGSVTILGHKVEPKVSAALRPPSLIVAKAPSLSRKQRKEQQKRSVSLRPPQPPAPKPPANWLALSAERIDQETPKVTPVVVQAKTPPAKAPAAKPVVLEDWTLVRTKHNEIGWVLSRNLLMSVPDEVAQYAEGKQITAFFDLGQVNDAEKGVKHNWLWTTAAHALPYDFDSWRVFLWNTRKHRYETSFRKRDLEGYFPVHVEPPDPGSPLRTFEIIDKDDDGKMRRRTYTFDGHLVHLANTEDYHAGNGPGKPAESAPATDKAKPSWLQRQWAALTHRLSGD
jgi:hypothetical protein